MKDQHSRYNHTNRRLIITGAIVALLLFYAARLFTLQILSDDYKRSADSNAFQKRTLYPSRGEIYDCRNRLLVVNQPSYDVMVIMREVKKLDTLDFCATVGIDRDFFVARMAAIRATAGYSPYVQQVFMNQLSADEYGALQEKLFKFAGFSIRTRSLREYRYRNAANILGNIGEVDKKDIEADDYYVPRDYAGRSGVERSYEKILRGEKGEEILLRDSRGRIKGKYEDGRHDVEPVSGKSITLSIDVDLQTYGEALMGDKSGAIVMIEPSTGKILCLVSSPTYDPSLLNGRQRIDNYPTLLRDSRRPLLDRSIMGSYSPGSTFKPAQALVLLEEGVINREKTYTCVGGYTFLGGHPSCHAHFSPISLVPALATSCNAYFCWGLHEMLDNRSRYDSIQSAFESWKKHIVSMGYGYPLGVDLPGEIRGFIPNKDFYNKSYRSKWNSSSIISIAIGQGEINATPLQICNLAATIANRGFFITPHVVSEVEGGVIEEQYRTRRYTDVAVSHYDMIVEGMRAAVTGGTCRQLALYDVEVCGKTGTVQNPHGRDHSAAIAFAPMNSPRVAIVVYIENGGFGAQVAIPMVRLMLEKYFYGNVPPYEQWLEQRMKTWSTAPNSFNYIKKAETVADGE
ncbi:MAG: penicillin-binding protein 2 [Tannerella sp.]|jgi:penicillin-binding protein 2|nr:penicillin-binding protein 2 [Tannerella sp.]